MPKPKARQDDDYFRCRCCGAELPLSAKFCRHCGASDDCGWGGGGGEDEDDEELDLPTGHREEDDEFDYDEFLAEEFPEQAPEGEDQAKRRFQATVIVLVCLGL